MKSKKIELEFAKRFRALQEQKGWTIDETSKKIGLCADTISTYRRDSTPKFKHVEKIAEVFGVSLEFLVTGRNKAPVTQDSFKAFKKYFSSASVEEKEKIKKFLSGVSKGLHGIL